MHIIIRSDSNLLEVRILNFSQPEFWVSDFDVLAPSARLLGDAKITLNAVLVEQIHVEPHQVVGEVFHDGKWEISRTRDGYGEAVVWSLAGSSAVVAFANSKWSGDGKRIIDIKGIDENLLAKLLRFLVITPQVTSNELVYLHGSAITRDKRTVIILGPKGSGKTTYTLAANKCGWRVLAEDFALIGRDLGIKQFFPSVRWECRVRPQDVELVEEVCEGNTLSGTMTGFALDERGRSVLYPQGFERCDKAFVVMAAVLLDPAACLVLSDGTVHISARWLYDELHKKQSLSAPSIIYGVDFDSLCEIARIWYLELQNRLPAHLTEKSGNLGVDIRRFLQLLDGI